VLDEPAWAAATVIDLPYEWFPGDNVKPQAATEGLITFDGENLYVASCDAENGASHLEAWRPILRSRFATP